MRPATAPRKRRQDTRMLILSPQTDALTDGTIDDLPGWLSPGDLVVVNDAATLPASLHYRTAQGLSQELRVVRIDESATGTDLWVVLFGSGDWHTPTEHRPAPIAVAVGDVLTLSADLSLHVAEISPLSPRLVRMRPAQTGTALWSALYALGQPIQYSYLQEPLMPWSVQTVYGGRPWAVEMPSAGRPLCWQMLAALRRRGISVATLTHATGLSSTGDAALDACLPLPERYDIPESTAQAIALTKAQGGRVIAIGTTVVRALESATRQAFAEGHPIGTVRAGTAIATLRLSADTQRFVVDGILSGLHGPGESHFDLLSAFCPAPLLSQAFSHADQHGYQCHEFGDVELIVPAAILSGLQTGHAHHEGRAHTLGTLDVDLAV